MKWGSSVTNDNGVNEVRKGQAHLLNLLIDHMRTGAQNVPQIFLSIKSHIFFIQSWVLLLMKSVQNLVQIEMFITLLQLFILMTLALQIHLLTFHHTA